MRACVLRAEREPSCFAGSLLHFLILPRVTKKEETALVMDLLSLFK